MLSHSLAFDRPAYLALLALLPVIWWLGRESLASLGPWRRWLALTLRSLVTVAIVLALADVQYRRRTDELTVVYLLDQSLSIPAPTRQAMLAYVAESVGSSPDRRLDDRYAVIAFGRDAAVELPPSPASLALAPQLESAPDPEYSNLATAVERAQSLFPPDAAKRIVLVTDGNENRGNVFREARSAADAGVSIDVVPVGLAPRAETSVEKVDVPSGVRRGQPFDVRIVLSNESPDPNAPPAPGRLRLIMKAGEREQTVADQAVSIAPGKQVLTIPQNIDQADFYTYEAVFIPDDAAADGLTQNNEASAFTHVRGKGNVLLIENFDGQGEVDELVERLRSEDIEVTVTATDRLFGSLAELQRYDCVILANVSRSDAADGESAAAFTDEQIEMLVRNTRELGCGLIMLGGPDSFGAGGWANTRLEEAMPVDFQIKSAEVVPVGALALVIDRSGSMDGDKLAMAKAAAIAAIRAMGRRDYISVTAFDGGASSVVPLRRVGDYRSAANRVDAIGTGGGTDMYPGMVMGFGDLRKAEAAVRHMIVLTDGLTPEAKFDELVRQMRMANITVTTMAVGSDANIQLLQRIAAQGRGKFYSVLNPRNLPRIFLREVRRVARPLVYEPPAPVQPRVVADHEILSGVESGVPPISGLVLTSVKDNPLVEVVLRSPQPATEKNATVLATWTYGAGKAAVLTTDAGRRWASAWPQWEGYNKFFSQMVRWAMRPTSGTGDYTVATTVRDDRTQIVVTALTGDEEFLNDQAMSAAAIAPDMKTMDVRLEQTAPGRYVGEFDSSEAGTYLVVVNPGNGAAPIRTGVSVGYSPEYRDHETNMPLLESLARLRARNGPAGRLITDGLTSAGAGTSPFRRDLPSVSSRQPIWPWVVAAGTCLFWGDVFVRRVQVNFAWMSPAIGRLRDRLLRREAAAAPVESMRRLRSRKEEVAGQMARQRSARFEDERETAAADESVQGLIDAAPAPPPPRPRPGSAAADQAPSQLSYTERLLQAKKSAQRKPRDRRPPR
ncbi:MAG TPA: VWA domain-containing protein [Lacipirellulaceae bacterium]|nr:VWA domain-containing protein [Lacipirellulaceae bacterium]